MYYDLDDEFKEKMSGYKKGCQIGGRDTDFMQVSYTLIQEVKEFFPINGVPESVVKNLQLLKEQLGIAEDRLELALTTIIEEAKKLDKMD